MKSVIPNCLLLESNNPILYADDGNALVYTFKRLSERLSKPEYLDGVVENLLSFNVELTEEFNLFFPEVIEYVKEICQCD